MDNKKKAKEIVEHVLSWVDKYGKISGKGENRKLMFNNSLINRKTHEITSIQDRIESDVAIMLNTETLDGK